MEIFKIEGNTYSLLETESLIKEQKEAIGKSKDDARMILNHKIVFEETLKTKMILEIYLSQKLISYIIY